MSKTTEEIIAEVPAEERQRFCQFWTGEPSRPCLATAQTSCRRCSFFSPFIGEKLQILTDAVNREAKRASSLEGQVTKLKKVVNYQRDLLENPDTGEWLLIDGKYVCSECGQEYPESLIKICNYRLPNYCPECGKRLLPGGENARN